MRGYIPCDAAVVLYACFWGGECKVLRCVEKRSFNGRASLL